MKAERIHKIRINILSFTLFLVFSLITVGALFQAVAEFIDQRIYPPNGRLYDMGENDIHLYCSGTGDTTIILESGFRYPSLLWDPIQRELAKSAQVCSYDHPGIGWSDPAAMPPEGLLYVEELNRLLRKRDIQNPLVFVSYGDGVLVAELFAIQYPENIRGLVFVSPYIVETIEEQSDPWSYSGLLSRPQQLYRALETWLGITRTRGYVGLLPNYQTILSGFNSEFKQEFLSMTVFRTDYWTSIEGDIPIKDSFRTEISTSRQTISKPLIILTDDVSSISDEIDINKTTFGTILADFHRIIPTLTVETCLDCGGVLPLTDPDVVVKTIIRMINQVTP